MGYLGFIEFSWITLSSNMVYREGDKSNELVIRQSDRSWRTNYIDLNFSSSVSVRHIKDRIYYP